MSYGKPGMNSAYLTYRKLSPFTNVAQRAATCTVCGEIASIYQGLLCWLAGLGTAHETTIITFTRLRSGIMAWTTVVLCLIVWVYVVIEGKKGFHLRSSLL